MPYIKYTWEFVEVFDKETHKKTGRREDIDITADEFKEWVIGRWTIPPEHHMKEFDHPAMFPEELPRRIMKLFSYKNDIVLDPFNGAGTTTLVAAKQGAGLSGSISPGRILRYGDKEVAGSGGFIHMPVSLKCDE